MATGLAIEAPAGMLGKDPAKGARFPRGAAIGTFDAPPAGAGDPAVGIRGPARFRLARRADPVRSRYEWVDALVTVAVMGAFAATVALMTGEWLDREAGSAVPAMVTRVAPSTTPHVAAIAVRALNGEQAL